MSRQSVGVGELMLFRLFCAAVIALAIVILNTSQTFAEDTSQKESTETAVRGVLMSLEKFLAEGQSQAAANLFSEEAIFITQTGEQSVGRAAIQQRFDTAVKAGLLRNLSLHPQQVKLPAANVAILVGEGSEKIADGEAPVTRFSMVLVKSADSWLISEANEIAIRSSDSSEQLQALSWLIGSWHVENGSAPLDLTVDWAPNRHFLLAKTLLHKKGESPKTDTQVIGWDPQKNMITSWHFDADGGFATGNWTWHAAQNAWTVDVAGVAADGGNTRALNSFTIKTKDEFAWQAVRRSLDGVPVANTQTLIAKRVK